MNDLGWHLDLDGAWPSDLLGLRRLDCRQWGPQIRYITSAKKMRQFAEQLPGKPAKYFVFGSGDFHHVSAMLVERAIDLELDGAQGDISVVCFDNHPDWDIRPPRWGCGAWVNRAMELASVREVAVWGCGNFEMDFPHRLTRNRAALASGRLKVFPWTERQSASAAKLFPGITRNEWRQAFAHFARERRGRAVYVTVDMDCLSAEAAITDWEPGIFLPDEIAWAIQQLRENCRVVAGDICGATSPAQYARAFQRFAGWWDHPKSTRALPPKWERSDPVASQSPSAGIPGGRQRTEWAAAADAVASHAPSVEVNIGTLGVIWPALTGATNGSQG